MSNIKRGASHISVEKQYVIGDIGENLFGGFLEHVGRAIYTGIYEPEHPTADRDGFRTDGMDMVRELHVPIVRYPGGNFVSGYHWEDGIGNKADRPRKLDLARHTTETNQVGIDDFAVWAERVGADVMPTVNMGTGTAQKALDYVQDIDSPNIGVLPDTYHMNIEERSIGDAIRLVRDKLTGFHTGENNRTPPGRGHLNWDEIFGAPADIRYTGRIISEPFVMMGGEVGRDIKVWRDLVPDTTEGGIDAEAAQLLRFTRSMLEKHYRA